MNPTDESQVRCRDIHFSVDTCAHDVPVTIRAGVDTGCDAFHPAALHAV